MSSSKHLTLAVLISGNGSNLQAIIDAITAGKINAEIAVVISDQADAYGLQRAAAANISTAIISKQTYPKRDIYDQALLKHLTHHQPDLVILSGFMRIIGPQVVQSYAGKMINIHPSLLPKYRGLHTYQKAIAAGDAEHGSTVHFVTEALDGGPIIAQRCLTILANDTPDTLKQRTQILEHQLYPKVIQAFCEGRIQLTTEGVRIAQV